MARNTPKRPKPKKTAAKAVAASSAIAVAPAVVDAVFEERGDAVIFKSPNTELWYRRELSGWTPERALAAEAQADNGLLQYLSDLVEVMLKDDRITGVLATLTHGLLGLPLDLKGGSDEARKLLQDDGDGLPGEWRSMHGEADLVKLLNWGLVMGVGLAQRVALPRVSGQMQRYRLDVWSPRWLRHQWQPTGGAHWFVQTANGQVPIIPGDGEWILFTPYGTKRPWSTGLWNQLLFPWLLKRYSLEDRANFSQVLGSPIWVGKADKGATEKQRTKFLNQLISLGKNGKLSLPAGWDLDLREATGKSWEIFDNQIGWADKAITVVLAGQLVTTEGNSGFSTGNVHDNIKDDIIRFVATVLETCLYEQSLRPWAFFNFDDAAAAPYPDYDTDKPEDAGAAADVFGKVGDAIDKLDKALSSHGVRVDAQAICAQYSIPLQNVKADAVSAPLGLAPTDIAKTVKVNEARSSSSLGPLLDANGVPDPRGSMLIADLAAQAPVQQGQPTSTPPAVGAP